MARTNLRGAGLASTTEYKVLVGVSASGSVNPPSYNQNGGTPADGTLINNGDSTARIVHCARILCAAGGVVSIYDVKASTDVAGAQALWSKTMVAGDNPTIDVTCLLGLYVVTDGSAKVTLCCA